VASNVSVICWFLLFMFIWNLLNVNAVQFIGMLISLLYLTKHMKLHMTWGLSPSSLQSASSHFTCFVSACARAHTHTHTHTVLRKQQIPMCCFWFTHQIHTYNCKFKGAWLAHSTQCCGKAKTQDLCSYQGVHCHFILILRQSTQGLVWEALTSHCVLPFHILVAFCKLQCKNYLSK
jgi:hypothetical protein